MNGPLEYACVRKHTPTRAGSATSPAVPGKTMWRRLAIQGLRARGYRLGDADCIQVRDACAIEFRSRKGATDVCLRRSPLVMINAGYGERR